MKDVDKLRIDEMKEAAKRYHKEPDKITIKIGKIFIEVKRC